MFKYFSVVLFSSLLRLACKHSEAFLSVVVSRYGHGGHLDVTGSEYPIAQARLVVTF